ncbi:MAG: methyltransferase domain-containing protein [Alphaproteobacteria bacterium]|nr:methyltransferase domain-containing protein [Alphaproteobacteria bacterium]
MSDNSEQIKEWNGALGRRWADLQPDLDRMTGPFGEAALKAAKPAPGERVIDVGCGCGDTALALARAVGAEGEVLGVDVSRPMLEVARRRLAGATLSHVSFREGDASETELPEERDLIFSRFGVMFFVHPLNAFHHLRGALRPSGRIAFCCWRHPRENPWAMAPLVAARQALGVTPPPSDPNAPGPFAFADKDRLNGILSGAGFRHIAIQPFDAAVQIGDTPRTAAENAARFGPVGRLIRDVGEASLPQAIAGMETALAKLAAPDGSVSANGAVWVVTATAS